MNAQDRYNSERYPDMTCFLALRNIERNERKERRYRMKENWIYRRGDVYLANLDPYIGSEQGGTRPVVVLQNNTGNYYCPTLIVAPITSKAGKKPSQPTHYYAERIHGLELPGMVLLEQIKTLLGRWTHYVKSLHGDNKLMKELLCDYPDRYTHFQFSILQLLPKAVTPDEVIQTETLWKKKLLTYEPLGMNAN